MGTPESAKLYKVLDSPLRVKVIEKRLTVEKHMGFYIYIAAPIGKCGLKEVAGPMCSCTHSVEQREVTMKKQ